MIRYRTRRGSPRRASRRLSICYFARVNSPATRHRSQRSRRSSLPFAATRRNAHVVQSSQSPCWPTRNSFGQSGAVVPGIARLFFWLAIQRGNRRECAGPFTRLQSSQIRDRPGGRELGAVGGELTLNGG